MITIRQPGDPYFVQPSDTEINVVASPAMIVFGPVGAFNQVVTVRDRTPACNGDISIQVPGFVGGFHITHCQALVVSWNAQAQGWQV